MPEVADKFWQAAVGIAGIGAIGAFVFWSLSRGWLEVVRPILPKITQKQATGIMVLFLILAFVFGMTAILTFRQSEGGVHTGFQTHQTPSSPPDKYKGWPVLGMLQDDVATHLGGLNARIELHRTPAEVIESERPTFVKHIVNNWDCWLVTPPQTDGDRAEFVVVRIVSRQTIDAVCYLAEGQSIAVFKQPKRGQQSLKLSWGALVALESERPGRYGLRLKLLDCQFVAGTGAKGELR